MCGRHDQQQPRASADAIQPARIDDRLIVALRSPEAPRRAVELIDAGSAPTGAIGVIRQYVQEHQPSASFSPLHPGLSTTVGDSEQWKLAVPREDIYDDMEGLAQIYVLNVASAEDADRLENELGGYEEIRYVHRPAIRYALQGVAPCPRGKGVGPNWGVRTCRFPQVWQALDTDNSDLVIAVIDQGRDEGHPELAGRITKQVPAGVTGSGSMHAGAVAGIIAGIRDNPGDEDLKGCCSAKLHLYNVWGADEKFDPCAYYRALQEAAAHPVTVINLSIGGPEPDQTEESHVQACLRRGVVLVAAMGNLGNDGVAAFPAGYDRVVAVGATSASDVRVTSSTRGANMWISAPGEHIWTVEGQKQFSPRTGTSFAAPFVTAAVWLARVRRPCLTVDEIRALLARSVARCTVPAGGGPSADVGHGRLDMVELLAALDKMEACA